MSPHITSCLPGNKSVTLSWQVVLILNISTARSPGLEILDEQLFPVVIPVAVCAMTGISVVVSPYTIKIILIFIRIQKNSLLTLVSVS